MLIKKYLKTYILLSVITIAMINPQLLIQSVKNGMIICYNNVIPSLYIFMIAANYRAKPEIMDVLSYPMRWYGRLMKIEDNYFAGCLVLSMIGGFAVGANYIKTLSERGYSKAALNVLSVVMINNSLAFCIFVVGANCLDNAFAGTVIYISIIMASMITAFILSFLMEYNIIPACNSDIKYNINIVQSINKAVESILIICGFVICFNFICEAVSLYTFADSLSSVLFTTFLEVTCGILKTVAVYGKNIYFLCFALSILPVCTLCQVFYFTQNKEIIKTLILSRLIHLPLSMGILSVFSNLFPVSTAVNFSSSPTISFISDSMEISSVLFVITIVFLVITDKNKLFTYSQ